MQKAARLSRELRMLQESPPHGVCCNQDDNDKDLLNAQIFGAEGTPYYGGLFHLEVMIPDRYPFEPPKVVFKTPIYHPNIDDGGRICLDTLKMPPQGAWKPSLNIGSVLTTIQLLMAEPNPDDPLMIDISSEYKRNKHLFNEKAKQWTERYAVQKIQLPPSKHSEQGTSDSEPDHIQYQKNVSPNIDEAECSGTGSNSRKRTSADNDYQLSRKKR